MTNGVQLNFGELTDMKVIDWDVVDEAIENCFGHSFSHINLLDVKGIGPEEPVRLDNAPNSHV